MHNTVEMKLTLVYMVRGNGQQRIDWEIFALPMYILEMHKWIFEANGYIFIITISNSYFW